MTEDAYFDGGGESLHVFHWCPSYGGGIKFVRAGSEDEAWDGVIGIEDWRLKEEEHPGLWSGAYQYLGTIDEFEDYLWHHLSDNQVATYGYEE